MNDAILNEIAGLLTQSLRKQLEIPRPSTAYGGPGRPGRPKPVSGRGRTPISPPIASGRLIKNIQVKFVENPDTGFQDLIVEMPIEGEFVSEGRRPGRWPPLAPIDKWVTQKARIQGIRDLKGRFIKRKSLVFLLRRSIGMYGYGGNNFLIKGYEEVAPVIYDLYGEEVAAYIQFQIDQMIENLRKQ
jgi:hypothetical protein